MADKSSKQDDFEAVMKRAFGKEAGDGGKTAKG